LGLMFEGEMKKLYWLLMPIIFTITSFLLQELPFR
jgi:hypothetical protein